MFTSIIALSPDGRRLVYYTPEGLYLRSMGELEAQRIPGTQLRVSQPVFSPDSESLAYFDFLAGQLKRIAVYHRQEL